MKNNNIKIGLLYYSGNNFGGAERRFTRIYNEIGKSFECDLIARCNNKSELMKFLQNSNCNYENFKCVYCFSSSLKCLLFLLFNKYDIIHFFGVNHFNFAVSLFKIIKRYRIIYSIVSVDLTMNMVNSKMTLYEMIVLKLSDFIDLLYPWGIDSLKSIIKHDKYSVTVGTFTDLHIFKPEKKCKLLVYAAARLENTKNPEILIESVNLCKDIIRVNGYKVLIIGKGELENKLQNKIDEYNLSDIVDMKGYCKSSDIFPKTELVFSLQLFENYPSQVIAEACASGCFMIITDVGYSRKCADDNFAYFVKNNCNDISNAIIKYIQLDQQYKNKSFIKSREFACKHYCIRDSVVYFNNVIDIVLTKKIN